jgi:hypothetical protein
MKKIIRFLVWGITAVLFLVGCDNGPLSPGPLDDFEIGLTSLTLSANELATIAGYNLKLTLTKKPGFANRPNVVWVSSNESAATVDQEGNITTATSAADVLFTMIKVYSVDDPSVYAVCPVSVYPDYGSNRTWNFQTAVTISGDTDYGNGMTILAGTGSGSYTESPTGPGFYTIDPDDPYQYGINPTGSVRGSMAFNSSDTCTGFSNRSLRTGGVGRILKIAAIQGPFTVTVNYRTNSNGSARWADIRFGDKEGIRYQGDPSSSTAATGGKTASWPYTGTDIVPFVYIEASAAIQIFDVIIEPEIKYPYTPVPDVFSITGADSFITGETKTYTTDITQALTNPTYEWAITSGSEYAEIIQRLDDNKSVEIKANSAGNFTLQVSITTSNPYDETIVSKTVRQTKAVTIEGYTAVMGVSIDAAKTVTAGGTVQVTADITPPGATNPAYEWIITEGGVYGSISSGGSAKTVALSADAVGTFKIKVRVTTQDPANPSNTYTAESNECTVTVGAPAATIRWEFTTNPDGWTPSSNPGSTATDVNYGQGMTLLAGTGSTNMNNDSGTGRTMGVYPAGAIPSGGTGFSVGYLRVSGGGTFAKIEGMSGPFTITINYSSPSANSDRWPVVKIGATSYNMTGDLSKTGSSSSANTGFVLSFDYEGTDTPVIFLKVNTGGLIFHDVIIATK